MLKKIPSNISPELMAAMMEMGKGDELVLAGGNYPAASAAGEKAKVIRMDGADLPGLLRSVLEFFPLDGTDRMPVTICISDDEDYVAPIWQKYEEIIASSEEAGKLKNGMDRLEKYGFEKRCGCAYAVVATGDASPFGTVILKKGEVL